MTEDERIREQRRKRNSGFQKDISNLIDRSIKTRDPALDKILTLALQINAHIFSNKKYTDQSTPGDPDFRAADMKLFRRNEALVYRAITLEIARLYETGAITEAALINIILD